MASGGDSTNEGSQTCESVPVSFSEGVASVSVSFSTNEGGVA